MTTITGAGSGTQITVNVSGFLQQVLAQQVLNAASQVVQVGAAVVAGANTVDIAPGGTLLGNPNLTATQTSLLASTGQTFNTNGAAASFVVAADGANATIINSSATSALVAVTGAGPNVLAGFAGANNFTTGTGGNDAVIMNGAANSLNSNGSDAIVVGGPSTITAGATASDSVLMAPGTFLAYVNGSRAGVDTVTTTSSDTLAIAGAGSTSVNGTGPFNAFYVDTSVGNVTLNANSQPSDAFNFVKDATAGSANVQVANFSAADTVNVYGYTGAIYGITQASGGTVLSLSDGSSVTFQGVSAATVQAAIKTAT